MRVVVFFLLTAAGTFILDQWIKSLFLEGYHHSGSCIDLSLHFNKGVAFSMFAFVGENLKWIQTALIAGMIYYMVKEGYVRRYAVPAGLLIGGALGNLYDRFVHEGVVDYVAWHCGFDFAVFNYADVAIDLAVVWIIAIVYFFPEKEHGK
jgi:signal peptidase II